jgi:hypothetical protein
MYKSFRGAVLAAASLSLALLVPRVASAQQVVIDGGVSPITINGSGFSLFQSHIDPPLPQETTGGFHAEWNSSDPNGAPGNALSTAVYLSAYGGSTISDILQVTFTHEIAGGQNNESLDGSFFSDPYDPSTLPSGTPVVPATGLFQNLSSYFWAQGAPTDFTVSIRSDIAAIPEPGSVAMFFGMTLGGAAPLARRLRRRGARR